MTSAAFVKAVRAMVGLPPRMIERLVAIANRLSPADRERGVRLLQDQHAEILKQSAEILKMIDADALIGGSLPTSADLERADTAPPVFGTPA